MDVWLRLGDVFFREGNFRKAADAYRKAVDVAPEAPLPRIALGETLFALGEYEEAAAHLRKAIEIDPSLLETDVNIRDLYADPAVFEEQMKALLETLEKHPYDPAAAFVAGFVLYFSGNRDQARAPFEKVKEILSEDAAADLFLAHTPASK